MSLSRFPPCCVCVLPALLSQPFPPRSLAGQVRVAGAARVPEVRWGCPGAAPPAPSRSAPALWAELGIAAETRHSSAFGQPRCLCRQPLSRKNGFRSQKRVVAGRGRCRQLWAAEGMLERFPCRPSGAAPCLCAHRSQRALLQLFICSQAKCTRCIGGFGNRTRRSFAAQGYAVPRRRAARISVACMSLRPMPAGYGCSSVKRTSKPAPSTASSTAASSRRRQENTCSPTP